MASSTNDKYEDSSQKYNEAADKYTGTEGYKKSYNDSKEIAERLNNDAFQSGVSRGIAQTEYGTQLGASHAYGQNMEATRSALNQGSQLNAAQNEEAKKYAREQAGIAASGAQSQATTAARAAGMNKAQAAMMGSQQNANAYQNAFGNAYNTQLGNAANNQGLVFNSYNNAYENNVNRANSNILNQQQIANANQQYQQSQAQNAGNAAVNAAGTGMGAAQQEGQAEYERKWGNWGNGLGIGGSLLKSFSDEKLKHYKECSKKVTYHAPSKIKALKYDIKKE